MKNISLFFLLSLVFFSTCRKDINETIVAAEAKDPITLIRSTINGLVIDESGNPVNGASVKVGTETQISQSDGTFRFEKVPVKKTGDIVQANFTGYFTGAAHINFNPDGTAYTEIKLLPKGNADIIINNAGGTITKSNGLKIEVPANKIIRSNGLTYQGDVSVYSKWIDPTADNLGAIMPGALTASDEDGNPLALTTFGMIAIALEGESGEELFIKENNSLRAEMPIPASLLADAPQNIDLWEYDLEAAQWLLSSACGKVDDYYVVNIPKPGYWNCDVAQPAICLSGQVFNSDLTFGCYLQVTIEDQTDNFIYWGFTDSLGYFCGSVPQGAPLTISITDHCDNIVYTDEIGPFENDSELDDIILGEIVDEYMLQISGTMHHCNTDDISPGHVAIRYPGNLKIFPFEANDFDIDLYLKCTDFPSMEITTYSWNQPAATITTIHNSDDDLNLGDLPTCEDLSDGFLIWELQNNPLIDYWAAPTKFYYKTNTTTDWLVMEAYSGIGLTKLEIENFQGIGTYTENVHLQMNNQPEALFNDVSSPDLSISITEVNSEYIEGTYQAEEFNASGTLVIIEGQFKFKVAP